MPAVGVPEDMAAGFEVVEGAYDGLFAGADGGAELVEALRAVVEGGQEALCERGAQGRPGLGVANFQPQGVLGQGEGERWWGRGGAVFDGEEDFLGAAPQIEVRVAPGVEIGAAAESLTGGVAGGLASVVYEEEGEGEGAGEVAQGGQDGGHFGGVIFVGGLKADVGLEDEQARPAQGEGGAQAVDVLGAIDAERRLEDETEFQGVEGSVAGPTELLDALAHVAGACHRRRRGGRARRAAGLAEGPPNGGHPVRARVADDAMALEPRPVVAKMAPAASQEVARYGGNGAIRSARARPFRNAVSTLSVGVALPELACDPWDHHPVLATFEGR